MKYIFLLLLNVFILSANAQKKTGAIHVSTDAGKVLALSLNTLAPSESLLIVVTDQNGETIFLDNKKHFSGFYEKKIDLGAACPGICTLRITNDDERYEYKVEHHP
jgi:hypothetical protein